VPVRRKRKFNFGVGRDMAAEDVPRLARAQREREKLLAMTQVDGDFSSPLAIVDRC
jgi:hypothetical protein